jgi:hypothetical protein
MCKGHGLRETPSTVETVSASKVAPERAPAGTARQSQTVSFDDNNNSNNNNNNDDDNNNNNNQSL